MAKIDELIARARAEAKNAEGEEKVKAEARAAAILEMKGEGFKLHEDEVGGLVKRKTDEAGGDAEKWKTLVGMEYDEAAKLFEDLDDDAVQALFGEASGDDTPVIERVQSALTERDQKIQDGQKYTQSLARDLYSERVENRLKSALGSLTLDDGTKVSLRDGRFDRVRNLVGEDELVEKLMKGETIEAGEFSARAKSLYEDMSEIFVVPGEAGDGENGNGSRTVAGHRIVEEAVRPHIPATPNGEQTAEITEEDRAARASSVY